LDGRGRKRKGKKRRKGEEKEEREEIGKLIIRVFIFDFITINETLKM
jgi:hypothetical protein